MSQNPLQLFEYSQQLLPKDWLQNVAAIERFNKHIVGRDKLNSNVVEIIYSDGRPQKIKTSSYVGVIRIGRRTIQILPKVLKYVDNTDVNAEERPQRFIIRNLLFMMSFSKQFPITEVDVSTLQQINDDFFEVLIKLFAKNLLELISRHVNKNYVNQEENVTFLKGKIKFKEHISSNAVFKHRFFMQFDEFSEDILLNQILKYTTHLLLNVSADFSNLKLLQQIAFVLSDISFKKIHIRDFEHVHFTRLNKEFAPILNLCRLFIGHSSVELSVDNISTFSFVFDMNTLFEKFIGEFIRRELPAYYDTLTLQGPLKWFVKDKIINNETTGTPAFQMRPDIVLERGDHKGRLIIDTKYKLLEGKDKKEGVSQSDLYQMHAYAKRYGCANVVMLYPQFEKVAKSFDFQIDGGPIVYIRMVDLGRNLKLEQSLLRNELADVVNVGNAFGATS